MSRRPNFLLVLTDQMRAAPPYESADVRRFRDEHLRGEKSLRDNGVSFERHYTMSAACTPSRASLLTGQYPATHGVTQTDGLAKSAESPDMHWLGADTVPTMGDWFRAGGYRTFYKGKWHASHTHIKDPSGDGYLQSVKPDGTPIQENIDAYLQAELLEPFGFSEWVGPEPHGLGKTNTGTVKDAFTVDETIALLTRLGDDDSNQPWLTVCSLLNPHDVALFGVIGLTQGLRYGSDIVPDVDNAPTFGEDMSTKPSCQASYIHELGKMMAPQPVIEMHRRFYYKLHAVVDEQLQRVLAALRATPDFENTIVIYSSDHGEQLGAHGGMREKWHNAYDETIRVPFVASGPPLADGGRDVTVPTSHADLIPTMLGLGGIDQDAALAALRATHSEAHPLPGRDLSGVLLGTAPAPSDPVLFTTDDEISEGSDTPGSPVQRFARKLRIYNVISQPNHVQTVIAEVEVGGEPHLVKYSRYHDDPSFWTVPGERDERLHGRHVVTATEPEPDEFELYDLTLDPTETRNLAHQDNADATSQRLQARMSELLAQQLADKLPAPSAPVA